MTTNISRHLETIYCDDIREETGNKLSYMGVYSSELTVPNAPTILPKLCIAVKAFTRVDEPFEHIEFHVVVQAKDNDEVILMSTGAVTPPPSIPGLDGAALICAQVNFALAPFQINEEFVLRVKATTEREELRAPALNIRVAAHKSDRPTELH